MIANGGKPPLAIMFVGVGLLVGVGRDGPFPPVLSVLAAAGAVVCVVKSPLAIVFVGVGLLVGVGREGPFAPVLSVLAAAGAVVCVVRSSLALSSSGSGSASTGP